MKFNFILVNIIKTLKCLKSKQSSIGDFDFCTANISGLKSNKFSILYIIIHAFGHLLR